MIHKAELLEKIKHIEENARDVINFLEKNGLKMMLFEKEFSWNEGNYAKITDGKIIAEFWTRDIVPPLRGVEKAFRAIKRSK